MVQQFPGAEIAVTRAVIPAHSQSPGCGGGPAHEFPCRCVSKRWIQIQMGQADSNGAMTPRGCGFGVFKQTQVNPVLLLLVKEGMFEGERLLGQLLVPRVAGCAREQGHGPADAGYAMCKAAYSFRRERVGPVSMSVPMFSTLRSE